MIKYFFYLLEYAFSHSFGAFSISCQLPTHLYLLIIEASAMAGSISWFLVLGCAICWSSAGPIEQIGIRAVSPDNSCGKTGSGGGADSYMCPAALPCCSVNGFCGSTNAYCLSSAGCQAAFGNCTAPTTDTVTPDETCGITSAGLYGYKCDTGSDKPCCSAKYVLLSYDLVAL